MTLNFEQLSTVVLHLAYFPQMQSNYRHERTFVEDFQNLKEAGKGTCHCSGYVTLLPNVFVSFARLVKMSDLQAEFGEVKKNMHRLGLFLQTPKPVLVAEQDKFGVVMGDFYLSAKNEFENLQQRFDMLLRISWRHLA